MERIKSNKIHHRKFNIVISFIITMVGRIINRSGKIGMGHGIKAFGFIIIAIGGGYASLSKDFRIGSLVIAIGALIVAIGEFFP